MVGSIDLRSLAIVCISLFLLSCVGTQGLPTVALDLFVPAPPDDPWTHKIEDWQARHEQDPARQGEVGLNDSELGREYEQFSRELRQRLVFDTVEWVQERSRKYYRADENYDHWATLGEVVKSGADDCDGLDLLTFVLLRRLGFKTSEIYRSILVEAKSGQHHMVTLWFDEAGRMDPFLLDPTGVISRGMVRLSEVDGWEPIQLFDEQDHFRVETTPSGTAVAGR